MTRLYIVTENEAIHNQKNKITKNGRIHDLPKYSLRQIKKQSRLASRMDKLYSEHEIII